jgi:hypothetical protein
MRISLDTSGYSRLALQHPELVKCVDEADAVYLSCIMLGELFAGFCLGRREKENRRELADFLELPGVRVINAVVSQMGVIITLLDRVMRFVIDNTIAERKYNATGEKKWFDKRSPPKIPAHLQPFVVAS